MTNFVYVVYYQSEVSYECEVWEVFKHFNSAVNFLTNQGWVQEYNGSFTSAQDDGVCVIFERCLNE